MAYNIDTIIHEILKEIKPSEHEKKQLMKVYEYVKMSLESCFAQTLNKEIEISLQGSIAKDTFLKNQSDIDVFLLFTQDNNVNIKWFEQILIPILINCFRNYKYVISYASHPYLTIYINGFEVNLVPAFKVSKPSEITSAVDRTPFHTEYIKKHLNEKQKDEVRLLKYFLKQWNLYGAEIAVKGFSGYLTELLIIAYNTFYDSLKNAVNWKAYRTCIDIEKHYSTVGECLKKFKDDVLVVVDPIDPRRNAAASLSTKNFALFKLLTRMFIEKPSLEFFKTIELKQIDNIKLEELINIHVKKYESCIYGLEFTIIKPVPDIVWGQLNRLKTALVNILKSLKIIESLYTDIWVDNSLTKAILVLEIHYCKKGFRTHVGPYAYDTKNALNFLIKNKTSEITPWIDDDGRIHVVKKISTADIMNTIINIVSNFPLTSLKFTKFLNLEYNEVVNSIAPEFIQWFIDFLERKPCKKILKLLEDLHINP